MCLQNSLNKHPLLNLIHDEHQNILQKLADCRSLEDKKAVLTWLKTEVTDKHHFKEESFLFSDVVARPALHQGGPYCVLYFDEHLMNRPSDRLSELTGVKREWKAHQMIFCNNKSPIDIPLEEHQVLDALCEYLIEQSEVLSNERFELLFTEYQRLLEKHITKEERCFFRVCEQLLSRDDLDRIHRLWLSHTA